MNYYIITLFLMPSLLTVVYAYLEYSGRLDRWLGRKAAVEGLNRLKSASGYPTSWIYNDENDRIHFSALEKRISKKTQVEKIRKVLAEKHQPSCIVVGGEPVSINGIPPEWDTAQKRAYLPDHSVMYLFGVPRNGGNGKADSVCTLGELEKWLNDEKETRKYYIGGLTLGLISVAFIVLRFASVPAVPDPNAPVVSVHATSQVKHSPTMTPNHK